MTYSVTTTEARWARIAHSGKAGLTVQAVREFIAECDAAEIPDTTRVSVEDKLASEGSLRSGYIEARFQEVIGADHNHDARLLSECDIGCPAYNGEAG